MGKTTDTRKEHLPKAMDCPSKLLSFRTFRTCLSPVVSGFDTTWILHFVPVEASPLTEKPHHQGMGVFLQVVHVGLQVGQEEPDLSLALGLQEEPLVVPKNKKQINTAAPFLPPRTMHPSIAPLLLPASSSTVLAHSYISGILQLAPNNIDISRTTSRGRREGGGATEAGGGASKAGGAEKEAGPQRQEAGPQRQEVQRKRRGHRGRRRGQ
ncbi:hypothetical protein EYF80_046609 [Liparis tanakae]|uniref:Uncharacterized protein n=1 Tax=Liparis tanakae TaxID=230148 RepID=A0A4Z2FPW6_9TELE|nr:hypothetical protein EYF80_046609 [Liparis tanakae]